MSFDQQTQNIYTYEHCTSASEVPGVPKTTDSRAHTQNLHCNMTKQQKTPANRMFTEVYETNINFSVSENSSLTLQALSTESLDK